MRITVRELKRMVREANLDTEMRHSAGYFMDGGSSASHYGDKGAEPLGDPDEQEKTRNKEDEERSRKSQLGARQFDRHRRKKRQA